MIGTCIYQCNCCNARKLGQKLSRKWLRYTASPRTGHVLNIIIISGNCVLLDSQGFLCVQGFKLLACWGGVLRDALLGAGIMLAVAWFLGRGRLLENPHAAPLRTLAIGLGGVCGLAGWVAVGQLGGRPGVWLLAWEAWLALHVAAACYMPPPSGRLHHPFPSSSSSWTDGLALFLTQKLPWEYHFSFCKLAFGWAAKMGCCGMVQSRLFCCGILRLFLSLNLGPKSCIPEVVSTMF
jgi:hypothetical protein